MSACVSVCVFVNDFPDKNATAGDNIDDKNYNTIPKSKTDWPAFCSNRIGALCKLLALKSNLYT